MTAKRTKKKQEVKTKIINFNQDYNIIKIYKPEVIEIYLEKKGYGNLNFICGLFKDIELTKNYIYQAIGIAELDNFWND